MSNKDQYYPRLQHDIQVCLVSVAREVSAVIKDKGGEIPRG